MKISTEQASIQAEVQHQDIPMPPDILIFDDGEPLESPRHRIAMNLLIRSVQSALQDRSDFFAGGNMFVYYSRTQAMNQDFRGPDFFVTLDVDGDRERKAWATWEEEGRFPDVIVEFLSPSTEKVDREDKKRLYERIFKTQDYFIFDPFDPDSLQGWHLQTGRRGYQPLQPNPQGWLWCEALELWLGTWQGVIDREPATGSCDWLRFYDPDRNLILLPEEAERIQKEMERAEKEAERERANRVEQEHARLIEQLRARGIDVDELLDR
ncbi:Uma2 family endonuclease [Leptolyngbya sp. AN03gr2]|uniref:Uma2 family endonuclease n=1 Tax=unclassified Leptolyngbya TaxID=2650499 RepID=UPI003D31A88F